MISIRIYMFLLQLRHGPGALFFAISACALRLTDVLIFTISSITVLSFPWI